MSNSLLLGGLEVMGLTAPGNPNPEYRLGTGLDFGALNPDTVTLSSLLLDGDFTTGQRTPNKTWTITILVSSPVVATRLDLSTRMDTLLQAIYAETFTVVWTPSSGVSNNYVGYRAACSPIKSIIQNDQLTEQITIVFGSTPFAASTALQVVAVPASGAVAQLQIDGMNSGSFTNGTLSTTTKYEGAGSMSVTMFGAFTSGLTKYTSLAGGRTITSVNLSAYPTFGARVRWDQAPANFNVSAGLSLTDSTGKSAAVFAPTIAMVAGDTGFALALFNFISGPGLIIPAGFNWAAITSWAINLTTNSVSSPSFANKTAFIDDLRGYPPGSISNSDAQGGVLVIPVGGSARTPVGLQIDRNGSTFTNAIVHSPPIDQDPDVTIHIGVSIGSDATIPAANMNYDDSFSVLGTITANGSGTRVVTVLVTQKIGATTIATKTWTTTVTGTGNTLVDLTPPDGPLTLPLVAQPPENTNGSLVFHIASAGGSADTWTNIDLLSTSGQSVLVTGLGAAIPSEALYIDQPQPGIGVGNVYTAGSIARTSAFSAAALAMISGGPIQFEPGNNKLLVASSSGALGATASFYNRWLDEALN